MAICLDPRSFDLIVLGVRVVVIVSVVSDVFVVFLDFSRLRGFDGPGICTFS